eukprot:5926340-Pleurochrysis_carterae.AAC.1
MRYDRDHGLPKLAWNYEIAYESLSAARSCASRLDSYTTYSPHSAAKARNQPSSSSRAHRCAPPSAIVIYWRQTCKYPVMHNMNTLTLCHILAISRLNSAVPRLRYSAAWRDEYRDTSMLISRQSLHASFNINLDTYLETNICFD